MRSWTDNAHIPQQHIDKLREFINTRIAKKLAYAGDTRVVTDCLPGIGAIVKMHGPKLITPKGPAEKPDALLFEKNRTFGVQFDKYYYNREQPRSDQYPKKRGYEEIDDPFEDEVVTVCFPIMAHRMLLSNFPALLVIK
jgi:hypothetical protein